MRRLWRERRRFGSLLVLSIVLMAITVTGCSSNDEPVNDSTQRLGTILQISIRDGGYSTTLTDRAFERVAEIERRMSTSEDDYESTELLQVNRAAGEEAVAVSEDTFEVLQKALEFSRLSQGAFDVTIWPLVKLWAIGSGGSSVPPEDEIDAARSAVDHRRLELDPEDRTVYLPEEGMGVDVGAIAKGYAADEAARILREAGVEHALLDFGGNILVIGDKPDDTPWRIGVQRPDAERTRYLGIVSASDKTVVTSGPYERFFVQDGERYHHILDADTGFPARNGIQQVTIIADRSIDADALSTATYVMGIEEGLALAESLDGVEAVFITDDRLVHMTSGAGEYFELTDDEFSMAEG
ncbi:MAG TPA: FAD:protein FMN transferase [Alkalispirochaeta sp.]|nr:FAD:protein FMN transferase [Alkalispirochaeta sp.]